MKITTSTGPGARGSERRDDGPARGTSFRVDGAAVTGARVVEAHPREGALLRPGRGAHCLQMGPGSRQLDVSERERFGVLVGESLAMRRTFRMLERAAASDATVLLEGETGTGKTQAARSIHMESKRGRGPFVVVDCAALPVTLLETELFGHVKGAFTGAESNRTGAFEAADGGTLLLDEIGELPPELQSKLLGVIENREVRPIGSNSPRRLNVRLIAATHRDLRADVERGTFRADLYFRLAVIRIAQPPLRDRPEDLPGIAEAILRSLGATLEQSRSLLTDELLARIRHASWPGNVRELRNYLERCLVFEDVLPLGDVTDGGCELEVTASLPYAEARRQALRDFERVYFTRLLDEHHGRVASAATAARIDRTHLYRVLRRHKLPRSR